MKKRRISRDSDHRIILRSFGQANRESSSQSRPIEESCFLQELTCLSVPGMLSWAEGSLWKVWPLEKCNDGFRGQELGLSTNYRLHSRRSEQHISKAVASTKGM